MVSRRIHRGYFVVFCLRIEYYELKVYLKDYAIRSKYGSSALLKTDKKKCGKDIHWHGDLPSARAVFNSNVTTKTEAA